MRRSKLKNSEEILACLALAMQYTPQMVKRVEGICYTHPMLIIIIKESLKNSFSKWTWAGVCSLKRFNISPAKAPERWTPKRCVVPTRIMQFIGHRFKATSIVHGPPNTGKEIRRNQYILSVDSQFCVLNFQVLDELCAEFGGNLTIDDEGSMVLICFIWECRIYTLFIWGMYYIGGCGQEG